VLSRPMIKSMENYYNNQIQELMATTNDSDPSEMKA
jgi:hypothetical protein